MKTNNLKVSVKYRKFSLKPHPTYLLWNACPFWPCFIEFCLHNLPDSVHGFFCGIKPDSKFKIIVIWIYQ